MANYKETNVSGTSYTRARLISFTNEDGVVPSGTFVEEKIITLGTDKVHQSSGQINVTFDPTKVFHKYDPVTGTLSLTENMTQQDLFLWLHGLYLGCAFERDSAP